MKLINILCLRASTGREERAGSGWSFAGDLARVYWDHFDSITGLRAAFFSLAPLVIGIATNQLNAGVISSIGALNEAVVSTLGALNLSFVEGLFLLAPGWLQSC